MNREKFYQTLDLVSPLISGASVLLVLSPYLISPAFAMVVCIYPFTFYIPYFCCPCTCGRRGLLFSWGALGAVTGYFLAIPIAMLMELLTWSSRWVGFPEVIYIITISTIIFSYLFQYLYRERKKSKPRDRQLIKWV